MKNQWKNKFWSPEAILKTILCTLKEGERGIKKVYFVEDLGKTPARCLRSTGECWVALKWWRTLPFEHKIFILLHENAHIVLNSSDEKLVDAYAHKQYMDMGFSLTESIYALSKVLSFSSGEHTERLQNQMVRATVYDITVNKNKKLEKELLNKQPIKTNFSN